MDGGRSRSFFDRVKGAAKSLFGGSGGGKDVVTGSRPSSRTGELARIKGETPYAGLRSLRDQDIVDGDFEYLARRNEMASAQIRRMKTDPWRGGYEIRASTEDLEAQAKAAIEALDLDEMLSRAFAYEKAIGMSLLRIPVPTAAGPDEGEPNKIKLQALAKEHRKKIENEDGSISYTFGELIIPAEPISRFQIEKYVKDDAGKPLAWNVYEGGGISGNTIKVHRSRIIHLCNWLMSGDPFGTSELLPQYDVLTDFDNISLAMVHMYQKGGLGIPILWVPESATDEEWLDAQANWKDLDIMSEQIFPQYEREEKKWKAEILSWGGKGLDPTPFVEALWNRISAVSGISKVILRGTEAGKLTGSELNYTEFYAIVEKWRKELSRYYDQIFKLLQSWGYLDEGKIAIEWSALDTPTQKEQALTFLNKSLALMNLTLAVKNILEMTNGKLVCHDNQTYIVYLTREKKWIGIPIPDLDSYELEEFTEDQLPTGMDEVYPDPNEPTPQPIPLSGTGPGQPGVPPGTPPSPSTPDPDDPDTLEDPDGRVPGKDKVILTPEQLHKIREEWGKDLNRSLDGIAAKGHREILNGISKGIERWLAQLEQIMEPTDATRNDDVGEIIRQALATKFKDQWIRDAYQTIISEALETGWIQTSTMMGFPKETWKPGMPWAARWMDLNLETTVRTLVKDIDMKMLQALSEGLNAGEGYQKIASRVLGKTADYSTSEMKAVHRVAHAALNASRAEAAVENGTASEDRPMVYITMGDEKVRPEHKLREGNLYPPDQIKNLLTDWNCRCTCVPSLAVERVLGRGLKPEELGGKPVAGGGI
jgi:hypothetical protein